MSWRGLLRPRRSSSRSIANRASTVCGESLATIGHEGGPVATDRASRRLAPRRCTSRHSRANIIAISYFGLTFAQFTGISFKKWRYSSRIEGCAARWMYPERDNRAQPIKPHPPSLPPKVNTISIHTAVTTAFAQMPSGRPLKSCSLFKGNEGQPDSYSGADGAGRKARVITCRKGLRVF